MAEGVAAAQARIAGLAQMTAVHRAFHWLHLQQQQLLQWQMELSAIPAPFFGEAARAGWFIERFRVLGLQNVHLDEAGNALGEFPAAAQSASCILLSAHLDTVFPAGTDCGPRQADDRLLGPGICDNAAGLAALLGLVAALRHAQVVLPMTILFAANVGEEGEGNLRGMRHLFETGPYRGRIRAAIALEGSGTGAVVTRAIGSQRFRVTVAGPGGHSWTDAGCTNPIFIISRILVAMDDLALPENPRTTLNAGIISGGTSINSVPERAEALLDLRSLEAGQLAATEALLREVCARFAQEAAITFETIGNRPASSLPENSSLLGTIRAVDRHLAIRTEPRVGSTDANLPLSLGVPAVAMGAGGVGGGIHTRGEWYDPRGREAALRRVLLTLLDTAQLAAAPYASGNG